MGSANNLKQKAPRMPLLPRMSRVRRRSLLKIGRKSHDPALALRFQAIAKFGLGWSSVRIAHALDLAVSTVVKAAHRFGEFGIAGLHDGRKWNGMRKVDDAFRRRIVELLRGTPEDVGWSRPTWTRELLCLQMADEGWPKVAVCTMGRALAYIGARLGTPKPIVLCPWPRDERLRVLAKIRALEALALEARACGDATAT